MSKRETYTKAEAEEFFGRPVELEAVYYSEEDATRLYWTRIRKDGFAKYDSVEADTNEIVSAIEKFLEVTNED